MELLYVWVEEYGNIKRQGFNFSPNYDFEVKEEKNGEYTLVDNFEISGKNKQPEKFFGENISNITAIVGKNGSGKSTLLNLINCFAIKNYFEVVYEEDEKKISCIKLNEEIKENIKFSVIFKIGDKLKCIGTNSMISIIDKLETEEKEKIEIAYYSNFISNYNMVNDYRNENISTDSHLRSAPHVSQINNYLLEDCKKQIDFLIKNESLLTNGYFDKYIKNLSSINSIVVKINHEEVKYKNLFEKLKSNFEDEMEMVEEEVKNIVLIFCSYLVGRLDLKIRKFLKAKIPKTIDEFFNLIDSHIRERTKSKVSSLDLIELETIKIFLDYKSLSKNKLCIGENNITIKLLKRNEFEIRFKKEGGTSISDEFKIFYEKINVERIRSIFSSRWSVRLSSGELSLLQMMGRFFSVEVKENQIFLLDEPEITFHPDWQRNMVVFLKDYFSSEKYFSEEIYKKVQIILTSHSPFVASDLPRENVIMLDVYDEKDEEVINGRQNMGNCKVVKNINLKTFGANIFDLYTDAFFVESSFGEFAKGKIKEVVRWLEYTEDKNTKERTYINEKKINKEQIEYILNSIGEPLVKNKLQKMYDEYKELKIKKLSDDEKNEKILEAIKNSGLNEKEFKKFFGDKND